MGRTSYDACGPLRSPVEWFLSCLTFYSLWQRFSAQTAHIFGLFLQCTFSSENIFRQLLFDIGQLLLDIGQLFTQGRWKVPTHYQAEQTFIRDLPVSDPAPELTARRCFAESQAVDRNSSATSSCRPNPLKRYTIFFISNGPSSASFSFIFRSFQTYITIFTTSMCEKCPFSIWCRDSNSRPLGYESFYLHMKNSHWLSRQFPHST